MGSESVQFETLRGYKAFSGVISRGRSVFIKPIRCFYTIDAEAKNFVAAGFAVAKSVRLSSERNLVKRRMREAYRRQKQSLTQSTPGLKGSLRMVLMFAGGATNIKKDVNTDVIRRAVELILPKVVSKAPSQKQ